jgi:type VI secretion system protein ImpK
MMAAARDDSYLIEQLLDFHAELVRIKHSLVSPNVRFVLTGPDASAETANALQLGQSVRNFLDLQAVQAEELGGRHGREQAEGARYLKVALADEALISLPDWPQRRDWIACPLEYQIYGTRNAGERIFDRISLLLQEQPPVQRELALLYLMALAMGFQGCYRKQDGAQAALQGWRRELYRHAYGRWPDTVFAGAHNDAMDDLGPRLMPQPYRHTLAGATARLLPNPRRWSLYFVLTALSLLLLSQVIWQIDTGPLSEQLAQAGKPTAGARP